MYINSYAQQRNWPAAYHGQQEEHGKELYDNQRAFNMYRKIFQQDKKYQVGDNTYNGPNDC